ncbi:Uncharacterised protein [Enterococcus casseliflavus]|uniref:Glycosyl transferase family 28 C-terminal domain-containing protein n=1 Tax=Enterococcus casseliflavus TaxID=37734 RepID=A0A6N3FP36_ENTCA
MIFITLGSQKFQFNRLLQWMDQIIDEKIIDDEMFAQIGYSDYHPKNFSFCNFLNRKEFLEMIDKADLVISHAGTGSIVTALKLKKKVIVVPRKAVFGEHIDDHQYEITKNFTDLNFLYGCTEFKEMKTKIKNIYNKEFTPFVSNNNLYIKKIKSFIDDEVE